MDLLDRMLEHDRWATAELLEASADLSPAQLDEPFDIGHRTLRATFDHLIFNIEAWTAVMAGQPVERGGGAASVAALTDRHERAHAAFAAVARRVRDEGRWDELFNDHFDEPQTLGAGVVHVVLHNEGHRVEVLHILERLGVPGPPEVDHALWDHVRRQG